MVTIGYRDPMDASYVNLKRSAMNYQQKKESKNHYKAIRILLNSITYNEYENITNKYVKGACEGACEFYENPRRVERVNM
jgi:hypothetical protein